MSLIKKHLRKALKGILCIISFAFSQDPEFNILNYSPGNGLSQSYVEFIFQDKLGFIWIGTEDGLNKFDGYNFTVFKNDPLSANSLTDNSVKSIIAGKDDEVWIGTELGGLNKFDTKRGRITQVIHDSTNNKPGINTSINKLLLHDGKLWMATDNGLCIYDTTAKTFSWPFQDSLSSNYRDLIIDKNQFIWICGPKIGLRKINPKTHAYIDYKISGEDGIYNLAHDPLDDDYFYASADYGALFHVNINSTEAQNIGYQKDKQNRLPKDLINSILPDTNGTIWVGMDEMGLIRIDTIGNKLNEFSAHTINAWSGSNSFVALFKSRAGIIWAGVHGVGLKQIYQRTKKFKTYRFNQNKKGIIPSNMVNALMIDRNDNLWIITEDKGLSRYNRNTKQVVHYYDSEHPFNRDYFFEFAEQVDDKVLLSTYANGLYAFDPASGRFENFRADTPGKLPLSQNGIFSIFEDSRRNLWLSYLSGEVEKINLLSGEKTTYHSNPDDSTAIPFKIIYTFYEDNFNNLWLAPENKGLTRYNPKTDNFKTYTYNADDPLSLSNNSVTTIYQDRNDRLWVGTYGGGINRFDYQNETFISFKEEDGLPNNVIYGILEDDHNNLWLSTNNGISCFNTQTHTFSNYDISDGLQSNEFNPAYARAKDGEMFFGGINGLNSFYPEEIKNNTFIPPVHITNILLANQIVDMATLSAGKPILDKSISYEDHIFVNSQDNVISFEFAALNYINPTKNEYAYKLEGFDDEWIYSGNRRFITYSNLAPGDYVFKVRGSNDDEIWNTGGAQLKLTITPAYWQTWWFKILMAIGALLLFLISYFYRLHGMRQKNKLLNKINNQLHKEIREKKQVELDLISSKTRFRQLAHATMEAIIISESNIIIEVNQAAVEMFGISRNQLRTKRVTDLFYAEYKSRVLIYLENAEQEHFIARAIAKDGSAIDVELNSKQMEYDQKRRMVTSISDITNKLIAENNRNDLEDQMRQMRKMDAIGKLAGSVAHDFNNMLTVISGFAELAMIKSDKENPISSDLNQILSITNKASELTKRLLAFSRKQPYKPIVLNLNTLISKLDSMIRRLMPADIKIEYALKDELPNINADIGHVEQIFFNLILNARDAITNKPGPNNEKTITVRTETFTVDEKFSKLNPGLNMGEHILLTIIDTGTGMEKNIIEQIFEPFFTTKQEGHGTGLGLSTVYANVRKSNGHIAVESQINIGTTFRLYWPITNREADQGEIEMQPEKRSVSSGTVLVVDDEEGVRDFTCASLSQSGFQVYSATNGKEALQLMSQKKIKPDIMVCDLNMPEMNGNELSKTILDKNPQAKILIMSGFNDNFPTHNNLLNKETHFLQKPFTIDGLVDKVRSILDN